MKMAVFNFVFFLAVGTLVSNAYAAPRATPMAVSGFPPPLGFPGAAKVPTPGLTVTITNTITIFGPVATEMVTELVTATQMINTGTTTDIRLTDTTNFNVGLRATVVSRVYEPRPAEVSTSVVSVLTAGPGFVFTKTDVVNKHLTVTVTNTQFETTTVPSVTTCTIEHFSTAIEVEIIPIMMTTTLYETSTRTNVDVVRTTTTIVNPNPYYNE